MLRLYLILLGLYYVSSDNLQLPEGSPCAWNNVTGQCVSVYKCFSSILDIKNKEHPPICTYKDKIPIVCCTDCDLVNDTRLILISPQLGKLEKTGYNKAKDKCLDYIYALGYPCKRNTFVAIKKDLDPKRNCHTSTFTETHWAYASIGGRNAEREEYPHMALLGYGDNIEAADWLCGGSVISENYILTASHCLYSPSIGPVRFISLGVYKRTDPLEDWQKYNVKRAIPHPEYKPPSKYHDIALLETDREIQFTKQVMPACLHVDDQKDDVAEATGWGALGHKADLADTLQSVIVTAFDEKECAKKYPRHRHLINGYNHTIQMCYGDENEPRDTCEGDSGGPLQSSKHEQCVYTILGVTSYGYQCGLGVSSGMYTRVAHYVPWIENIVWP